MFPVTSLPARALPDVFLSKGSYIIGEFYGTSKRTLDASPIAKQNGKE